MKEDAARSASPVRPKGKHFVDTARSLAVIAAYVEARPPHSFCGETHGVEGALPRILSIGGWLTRSFEGVLRFLRGVKQESAQNLILYKQPDCQGKRGLGWRILMPPQTTTRPEAGSTSGFEASPDVAFCFLALRFVRVSRARSCCVALLSSSKPLGMSFLLPLWERRRTICFIHSLC